MATNVEGEVIQGSGGKVYAVSISYGLINAAVISIAAAPLLRFKLSLRALLVATTLVARGLVLIGLAAG